MTTEPPAPPEPRRWHPLRLGLRSLMILVLIAGGWLGWFAHTVRVQRQAVVAIRAVGGEVYYDFQKTEFSDPLFGIIRKNDLNRKPR